MAQSGELAAVIPSVTTGLCLISWVRDRGEEGQGQGQHRTPELCAWLGASLALPAAGPAPEGPLTVALGRLAPDTLRLADPDGVGGAQAVALVTQVQGH